MLHSQLTIAPHTALLRVCKWLMQNKNTLRYITGHATMQFGLNSKMGFLTGADARILAFMGSIHPQGCNLVSFDFLCLYYVIW